MICRLA